MVARGVETGLRGFARVGVRPSSAVILAVIASSFSVHARLSSKALRPSAE
jgi:hypothetical protein